jgi:hypothetical protein
MADALQQRTHATAALPAPPAEKNRQQRRILPDTPRAWPHGTWQEATYILGDLGLSIARFVSWCLTGVVRLLFGLLYAIARGFGALFTTISGGRLKQRAALILGWLALAGVLAGSTPWWGNIRTLVVEHWPHATTHFVPVAYVPPPSACVLPRAACAAPTPFLDGQPSITATQILAVLQSYHSPAATSDFAADLYDLGIKYGVNPAYALGFFAEESQCGTTGIAVTTLSLGNVRYTVSNSPVTYTVYNGFRRYATWRDGAEDWYWVIRTYYLNAGIRNIYDVTPIYAPSSDHNDPKNYADTVYQLVQSWAP